MNRTLSVRRPPTRRPTSSVPVVHESGAPVGFQMDFGKIADEIMAQGIELSREKVLYHLARVKRGFEYLIDRYTEWPKHVRKHLGGPQAKIAVNFGISSMSTPTALISAAFQMPGAFDLLSIDTARSHGLFPIEPEDQSELRALSIGWSAVIRDWLEYHDDNPFHG